ncbi:non-specific lipid transfer protein GPI-anchored 3-like [Capsicum chacoense]
MTNDAKCLCTVFGNADLMKGLNVTQDEALDFAKSCGAKPDLSLCKNVCSPNCSHYSRHQQFGFQ